MKSLQGSNIFTDIRLALTFLHGIEFLGKKMNELIVDVFRSHISIRSLGENLHVRGGSLLILCEVQVTIPSNGDLGVHASHIVEQNCVILGSFVDFINTKQSSSGSILVDELQHCHT